LTFRFKTFRFIYEPNFFFDAPFQSITPLKNFCDLFLSCLARSDSLYCPFRSFPVLSGLFWSFLILSGPFWYLVGSTTDETATKTIDLIPYNPHLAGIHFSFKLYNTTMSARMKAAGISTFRGRLLSQTNIQPLD